LREKLWLFAARQKEGSMPAKKDEAMARARRAASKVSKAVSAKQGGQGEGSSRKTVKSVMAKARSVVAPLTKQNKPAAQPGKPRASKARSASGTETSKATASPRPARGSAKAAAPRKRKGSAAPAKTTRVGNPKRSTTEQAAKRVGARGVDGRGAR
jgi:hypothetical protein